MEQVRRNLLQRVGDPGGQRGARRGGAHSPCLQEVPARPISHRIEAGRILSPWPHLGAMFGARKVGKGESWLTKEGVLAEGGGALLWSTVEGSQQVRPGAGHPVAGLGCAWPGAAALQRHPGVIEVTHPALGLGLGGWGGAPWGDLPQGRQLIPSPLSAFPPKTSVPFDHLGK